MPLLSFAVTVRVLNDVPAVAVPGPVTSKTLPLPAAPVAVKVSGLPVKEPLVAVSVLLPAVDPKVQLVIVAIPEFDVVADVPLALPPPVATAKVTLAPATGLP